MSLWVGNLVYSQEAQEFADLNICCCKKTEMKNVGGKRGIMLKIVFANSNEKICQTLTIIIRYSMQFSLLLYGILFSYLFSGY